MQDAEHTATLQFAEDERTCTGSLDDIGSMSVTVQDAFVAIDFETASARRDHIARTGRATFVYSTAPSGARLLLTNVVTQNGTGGTC